MSHLVHDPKIGGRRAFVQDVRPTNANGTTLLLLHTAGQSGTQWRYAAAPLARLGYRLLIPDLPGHGHSEPAPDGPVRDLRVYAGWLIDVLDAIHPEPVVPVGCSIGGKLAQELVVHHAGYVRAAVTMCAEPGPGRVKLSALERELHDVAAPSRADRTHLGTRAVLGDATPPERAEVIARMHCREDPAVSGSDLIGWGRHDVRDALPEVAVPMLFAAGAQDLWVNAAAVESAAQATPAARYVLLEGVGHYPMQEMPDFASLVDGWITDLLRHAR